MTTPREQLEEIVNKFKEHPAYKENEKVRLLIHGCLASLKTPGIHHYDPYTVLGTLRNELKKILDEIDNDHSSQNIAAATADPAKPTKPAKPANPSVGKKKQILDSAPASSDQDINSLFPNLELEKQFHLQTLFVPARFIIAAPITQLIQDTKVNSIAIELPDQEYHAPDLDEFCEIVNRNREIIRVKSAQGFRKLLVVPFAMDLPILASAFEQVLGVLSKNGKISNGLNKQVRFRKGDASPVRIMPSWLDTGISYNQDIFVEDFTNPHKGAVDKKTLINSNGAWQFYLVEDLPILRDIKHDAEPSEIIGFDQGIPVRSKLWIDAGQPIHGFIHTLQHHIQKANGAYSHEKLMLPETYLWMQLTSLLGGPKPVLLDHMESKMNCGTLLPTAYSPKENNFLSANWAKAAGAFHLGTDSVFGNFSISGLRTCVPLK